MFAFEDTIRYIENNLHREITIEELAKHSKYSKYHFCHLFKQTVGQPVGHFIKQQRLLRILHEIQSGNRAIDVILYYGFETYAGFLQSVYADVQLFSHSLYSRTWYLDFNRHYGGTKHEFL
ncbi:MAG: helix-turn-helix transcriptional regulator [Clostridia bacterium]|nr:helix-turn-helix transcriptional regulator [Clostridia bacterium]